MQTQQMTKYFWQINQRKLHSLEQMTGGIGLHVKVDKMEYMYFNQEEEISTLNSSSLKLVDRFAYLGSSISSTKSDISMCLAKVWTAIDRLSIIWKSDISDELKRNFFQATVRPILLYGCTTNARWKLYKNATSYV